MKIVFGLLIMASQRFLDPKSGVVFKKVFGSNPVVVKSLLNSILPLPDDRQIEIIEHLSPEQTDRIPSMKSSIVDVKCTDRKGRVFLVDMQMLSTGSFNKRLIYGALNLQMQVATGVRSFFPVFGLGIINDIIDENQHVWFHHYRHVKVGNPDEVLEGQEFINIELPKFNPLSWNHMKPKGVLWLRFLKEFKGEQLEVPEEFMRDPEIAMAIELTKESRFTRAELEAYEEYLDAQRTKRTMEQLEVPEEFLRDPEIAMAIELTKESHFTRAELEAYEEYLDAQRTKRTMEADDEA